MRCSIPQSPEPIAAASARYGLMSAAAMRYSTRCDLADPGIARNAQVRLSRDESCQNYLLAIFTLARDRTRRIGPGNAGNVRAGRERPGNPGSPGLRGGGGSPDRTDLRRQIP